MKKIVLLIMLLVGVSFAQVSRVQGKTPIDTSVKQNPVSVMFIWSEADSLFYPLERDASGNLKVAVSGATFTGDSLTVNVPSTITNGTKSVTTSASALASTASAKMVIVTNDNESGIIYWGGSGVTTSNGEPIYPKTSHWIEISDPATVFVIAASTLTARYKVLN